MLKMKFTLCVLLFIKIIISKEINVGAFSSYFYPCAGSKIITIKSSERPLAEVNRYLVVVKTNVPAKSVISVKLDSAASVRIINNSAFFHALFTRNKNFIYEFQTIATVDHFTMLVTGPENGNVPYLTSMVINSREYCENPVMGYLDDYVLDKKTKQVRFKRDGKKKKKKKKKKKVENINEGCGRRKHLDYIELIVNGATSKPGDWPWHAAIYRRKSDQFRSSYICGGTLISKLYVLTAAHCVCINKVPVMPDILTVVLGKYNFIGYDETCQEINVNAVKPHEEFGCPKYLDNDIALLQLSLEAVYNHYVQPACIWYKKAKHLLPTDEIFGTVAGWGYDTKQSLAPQLRQITMPKIKRSDCIQKNPVFYGVMLKNERKFCAGWGNGTSPCNGDSGGGFMVFVPDRAKDESSSAGAWYIRGIVSVAVSFKDQAVCDPEQYVVFTNILKYKDWIQNHTLDEIISLR